MEDKPEIKLTAAEMRWQAKSDSIQIAKEATAQMLKDLRYFARQNTKQNLKDPDSFEEMNHLEYLVADSQPHKTYQAKVSYRARNSFGGRQIFIG